MTMMAEKIRLSDVGGSSDGEGSPELKPLSERWSMAMRVHQLLVTAKGIWAWQHAVACRKFLLQLQLQRQQRGSAAAGNGRHDERVDPREVRV